MKSPANKSQTVGKTKRTSVNQRILQNYAANNRLINMLAPMLNPIKQNSALQASMLPSVMLRDYEEADLMMQSHAGSVVPNFNVESDSKFA